MAFVVLIEQHAIVDNQTEGRQSTIMCIVNSREYVTQLQPAQNGHAPFLVALTTPVIISIRVDIVR